MAIALLWALLAIAVLVSARLGAVELSASHVLGALMHPLRDASAGDGSADAAMLWTIRMPRIVLGVLIGAALGASGAAMQGLFRNPLAEPGLVGVSSGAALGAVSAIVLGAALAGGLPHTIGPWILPLAAYGGGLLVTALSVRIARVDGRTSTALLLLAGVAVNALSGAAIGGLMHLATDAQLRTIAFWTLGSLGGATWRSVAAAAPSLLATILLLPRSARALNALLLGEAEAMHLGFAVERTKATVIVLTALGVGAAVSVAGAIGFVGLVVPHLVRLVLGPDHRRLISASALLGASLLTLADVVARTAIAPVELPVGVLTAAIGAPLFLWRLLRLRAASVMP